MKNLNLDEDMKLIYSDIMYDIFIDDHCTNKDELPFDDDSYTWRSDEYGLYGLEFYPVEAPESDGKLAQCFGKRIALETYASYDSMYLTEKSAIDFEVDKIIFKNVTNQEELDYMYEF